MSVEKVSVGLIGLGAMGQGVAANLIKHGYELVAYDVRAEAAAGVIGQGGRFAPDLGALAQQVTTFISFVVDSAQTEGVLYGKGGLVGQTKPGSIFVACSTMAPAYVKDLGRIGVSIARA